MSIENPRQEAGEPNVPEWWWSQEHADDCQGCDGPDVVPCQVCEEGPGL